MDDTLSTHLATVVASRVRGRIAMGLVPAGAAPAKEVAMQVDANGVLQVAGTIVITPGPPGGNIVTQADVVLPGVGTVTALGALPANTRTICVQNTVSGSLLRVREVGGTVGAGILLGYRETHIFSEACEALEAEAIGGVASAAGVTYETN